ncbi:hypothetical protein [Geobacillus phage TP-84]|uniref:Uncharacterized protein n=1 Tax=Geobacillus phage TP-84 TaxID=1965361 RepID=A0A1U9WQP1_9CAUD|nr:hypothetical protein MUK65_gp79 [Geobacillus phage TP-84]AQY55096.1 hypothetical protein [Geobacillus phage TP-84]
MAKTTTQFQYHSGVGDATSYIHTSEDYMNVYVTVELGRVGTWETEAWCKLALQRYENGAWKTIATAQGYAATGQNLNRTFSNISNVMEKPMRVKVDLYANSSYSDYVQTVYTKQWIR